MTYRPRASISFSADFTLSETEVRALDALVGYGDDAFIKAFKDSLGTSYIREHEKGLKLFFKTVREQVLPQLHDIDQARRDLNEAIRKREKHRREQAEKAAKKEPKK